MQTVLVISPHPDDEAIGCGGTICRHIAAGDRVEVIFLTSGEKGGHGRSETETISLREDEARLAAEILNIAAIEFWREPDGRFSATTQNVERLIKKIDQVKPALIYAPHFKEQHPDHIAAANLVMSATGDLNSGIAKPVIYMYEVWTPIQEMDHIVDITDFISVKLKAIRAYKSQCEVLKFDEAIKGLNRYRGEMHCWPGGDYAEVFSIQKVKAK